MRDALATADIVAAEDTRRLRRLAADLDVRISGQVVSYFEANEVARTPELIEHLRAGRRVLLVTDAGMPSVSDPGYRLVVAAIAEGIAVTCLPGPSAVTTALVLSGLPVDRFCFEGFLPRRAGERATRLRELAGEPRTMVFFEAPHRLGESLAALADAFGPERPAAVCRELTKTYEEVRRGPLAELVTWAAGGVRGEITVVVGELRRRPPRLHQRTLPISCRTPRPPECRERKRSRPSRHAVGRRGEPYSTRWLPASTADEAKRGEVPPQ